MQIEIHTDNKVRVGDDLAAHIDSVLTSALARFGTRIGRVDVHLADVNADKQGVNDKQCSLETRPPGGGPVAVSHHASTSAQACSGAAEKLAKALDHRLGRDSDHKGAPTIRTMEADGELA